MLPTAFSRRALLKRVSSGFGYLAFAGLSSMEAAGSSDSPLAPKAPHFPARAKRVIFLCMNGAPSHVDTFDYKPKLADADGKASDRPGRIPGAKLMSSLWKFQQRGKSGLWISELFPEVASHADELCVIRSMHTDLPAHPEAYLMLHTGSSQFIRPVAGRVDALRSRHRERRPARVHLGEADRAQRRRAELRQRISPRGLPGDPHRQRGAANRPGPGRQHQEPWAERPRTSAFSSTSSRR